MGTSESERDRILREERIKWEIRDERLRARRPQLILSMIIWTIMLTALVVIRNQIH